MLNLLANNMAQFFYRENIIQDKEDIEIYAYGLEVLISSFLSIFSVIIISLFLRMFSGTLIFLTSFIALRIFTGGYHASTHVKCFLILIMVYGLNLTMVYMLPNAFIPFVSLTSLLLSSVLVFVLSPLEDENKPLDHEEREKYRKISIRVLGIFIIAVVIFLIMDANSIQLLFFTNGIFAASTSLLAAKIKYSRKLKSN